MAALLTTAGHNLRSYLRHLVLGIVFIRAVRTYLLVVPLNY